MFEEMVLAFLDTHNYDDMTEQQKDMAAHQVAENAIKQATINNGTSAITERARRQASASSGAICPPVDPDASTTYTGGVLSSFSGAVSSAMGGAVGTAAGAFGRLFRGVGSALSAQQPTPDDAGNAYHSLPSDTQTTGALQSLLSANMQRDADEASQRSESIRSQVSQHLQDVGNQHVILPMIPVNSSSSSGVSDTLPAPPTHDYQPILSSSSSASVNAGGASPPISVRSSPPVLIRSSKGALSEPMPRGPSRVSVSASPPVSVHSSSGGARSASSSKQKSSRVISIRSG